LLAANLSHASLPDKVQIELPDNNLSEHVAAFCLFVFRMKLVVKMAVMWHSCVDAAAWNYYPPLTEEHLAAAKEGKLPPRLHAHADMDVLTILFQRDGAFCRPSPMHDIASNLSVTEQTLQALSCTYMQRDETYSEVQPRS
jgi:hypothetical protein